MSCKHVTCTTERAARDDGGRYFARDLGVWVCFGFGCCAPPKAERAKLRAARARYLAQPVDTTRW